MKNFLFIASLLSLACGCVTDYGDTRGRSISRQDYSEQEKPLPKMDTSVYFSCIRMQDDYDWRKDTALRTNRCELVLYKDMEEILSLPVSESSFISPDTDRHRIIDGHLYTDFSNDRETIIKRDGDIILRYPGREYLCGLVYKDGALYTLGQNRDSEGFSLRKDGEVIYMKSSGTIAGKFSGTSYGKGGGLFEIDGKLCFIYKQRISGGLYKFLVSGSYERELILPYDQYEWEYISVLTADQYYTYAPAGANIRISRDLKVGGISYYFFSSSCGFLLGNDMYLALTPLDKGNPSIIMVNGWIKEVDIGNGFLTGISVSVTPADGA